MTSKKTANSDVKQTRVFTRKDFKEINGRLVFEQDVDVNGNIEIDENLGCVLFKFGIKASGYICAKAGSGIKAGGSIEAGWFIKAGGFIKADGSIVSFYAGIVARFIACLRVAVGFNVQTEQVIRADVKKGTVVLGRVEKPEKEKAQA